MNIVITGDSWANGAYDFPKCSDPTHPGFEYYLTQQGHKVTNLAVRGGSNELAIKLLENFLQDHPKPDLHVFWQCAFMRDCREYFDPHNRNCVVEQKFHNLSLDWQATNVEDIIAPHIEQTCCAVKNLGLNTIAVGGNTKFHPVIEKYFDGIHCSASELVLKDFEDSYFSDRDSLEIFNKTLLTMSDLPKQIKYKLAVEEMNRFIKKYDTWYSNETDQYIIMEHGTTKTHHKIFMELLPFCS